MEFFNKARIEAIKNGKYLCSACGAQMRFEDEWEETLICPECGHEVDLEHYGFENDEEYEALYPTLDDADATEEDTDDESYEEVYGELDD